MDQLDELELKEQSEFAPSIEQDDFNISVDIDDVKVNDIPSVEDLRNREDDLKTTELLDFIDRYQRKVDILRAAIAKINEDRREKSKQHRGSVIDLHNRMFAKLINQNEDTQSEADVLRARVIELENELAKKGIVAGLNSADAATYKESKLGELLEENMAKDAEIQSLKAQYFEVKKQLKTEKTNFEKAADSHRKSVSTLHTNMFKKLLDAEDDFDEKVHQKNEELQLLKRDLAELRLKNENADKLRRDSIQTVHNNMLTKVLNAQAEADEKEEKYQNEIKELKAQLRMEILKNQTKREKEKEQNYESDGSDMSDLETEQSKKSKDNNPQIGSQKFDDLWEEADDPSVEISRLKGHIDRLERELAELKNENVEIEKQRKDSIHHLHNNMFQKLLDAEFEYENELAEMNDAQEELKEKVVFYEEHFENDKREINPKDYIHLKDELKAKNDVIESNKTQIFELTAQIEKANEKIESLKVSVANEQQQRRGSVAFLSKQMMAKLLDAENENEEQRQDFKKKLQRLEKELEQQKEMSFNLEKTRRNSVTKVSQTMFGKLLEAEKNKKKDVEKYEKRIKDLEQQLAVEMLKTETLGSKEAMNEVELKKYQTKAQKLESKVNEIKQESDNKERKRRESFSQLQNSYWKKLVDAEDNHEKSIKALKHEIVRLQTQITEFKKKIEWLTTSKYNLIVECDKQMNELRNVVTVYAKKKTSWF